MSSEFVLDPVSGIPDPPTDESMLLEWAGELTKSLQRDHVANVDRTETMIMTDRGTNKRPPSTGSRRLFHDSKSGTIYIDTEITPVYSEWVPINESSEYVSDGLGVYVQLSTTLPWTTSSSGYISWDEEVWDAEDYWAIGSPTEINMPEKKHYQVVVEGKFDNLEEDGVFLVGAEIEGVSSPNPDHYCQITSAGTAVEYDVKVSFIIEMNEDDTLKIGYVAEDSAGDPSSADFSELSCVVTPVTLSTGGGAPNVQSHAELSGLTADDHLHYLLASAATDRATFAANWTDLTDSGETALHTHAETYAGDICIPQNSAYQIKDGGGTCRDMVQFNGTTMEIGNANYAANIRGGAMYLIATTLTQNTGAWDVNSTGGINIDTTNNTGIAINSDTGLTLQADTDIILKNDVASNNVIIDTHGPMLQGTLASSSNVDMIGVTSSAPADRIAISDASVDVWLNTDSVYVGPASGAASGIHFYTAASTATKLIEFSAIFELGATTETVNVKGSDIYLTSNNDLIVEATNATFDGIVDVAGRVRLPYLAGIPASPANGDMWMESDGLHIYYGGSEYYIAGASPP